MLFSGIVILAISSYFVPDPLHTVNARYNGKISQNQHSEIVLLDVQKRKNISLYILNEPVDTALNAKIINPRNWKIHDPTTLNRQGPDIGEQYRSIIFYYDGEQEKTARASKDELQQSGLYDRDIVTEIVPAEKFKFYMAEDYHQQYLKKRGRNSCRF
jgi:methionine-S-sulfoxide reductase